MIEAGPGIMRRLAAKGSVQYFVFFAFLIDPCLGVLRPAPEGGVVLQLADNHFSNKSEMT